MKPSTFKKIMTTLAALLLISFASSAFLLNIQSSLPPWLQRVAMALSATSVIVLGAITLLAYYYYTRPPVQSLRQPRQRLAIESSEPVILEGEILDDDEEWLHESGKSNTEEIPIVQTDEDEPDGPSAKPSFKGAHVRFFVDYAVYTLGFILYFAAAIALCVWLWRIDMSNQARWIITGIVIAVSIAATWMLSIYLRRADARWNEATTPLYSGTTLYDRPLHISLLAHSILLQAGIWIAAFLAISYALSTAQVDWHWHILVQAIVTLVNVFFIVRTFVAWRSKHVIVTTTKFLVDQADILMLFLTSNSSMDQELRTLSGNTYGERTLSERFAYRTRGTVFVRTQETEGGETLKIKLKYISGIEQLKSALRKERPAA